MNLLIRTLAIFLCCASLGIAQEPQSATDVTNQKYCAGISDGLGHEEAFRHFCEWVVSFDAKLPNIIGDQDTRRYHTDNGKERKLIDTTSARIAYIDDQPHFSEIAINHVKLAEQSDATSMMKLYGAWSYDDFGGALRLLFGSHTKTHFMFDGESSWEGMPVLVFNYEVMRDDNLRWALKTNDKRKEIVSDFPGYRGRILLASKSFDLVRFERATRDIEKSFPLRFGSNQVNYRREPLGDGTSFVLPVEATVTFCHDDKRKKCEINQTTFQHWQKFGAKSRIVTGETPEQ
ncbi:hypothetical protein Acid345_1761 [Candidatus Koribacter versatilis Ellin345]|uniref:Uncharacterized protein n=1 Tax=Koribacter versatilis (strain Ellin345) TaxID=204669 RepID=Q1IQT8_KORVE|nr:hypothetical protein Acid345_1761 [Candidatus Koribacter versatilis Ellin345]